MRYGWRTVFLWITAAMAAAKRTRVNDFLTEFETDGRGKVARRKARVSGSRSGKEKKRAKAVKYRSCGRCREAACAEASPRTIVKLLLTKNARNERSTRR